MTDKSLVTMNPKRTLDPALSILASRILKTVGVVAVLAGLIQLMIALIPYQIFDRQWQLTLTTQAVDRGLVPLLGLVLILMGFWIDHSLEDLPVRRSFWQNPRAYVFAFASLLGLIFVLIFPLHLYNMGQEFTARSGIINDQVKQRNDQLEGRIQSEIATRRAQITQLLGATDEQLSQLTQSGQLTQEQAGVIRKFKAEPGGVDPFLATQAQDLRTQGESQIKAQETQDRQLLELETKKLGLRVGINSLLLAIGYIVLGWLGLRHLLSNSPSPIP